jgi:hypothetical protein
MKNAEFNMTQPTTNRELYLAIGVLGERYKSSDRSLEHYLLALYGLARPFETQQAIPLFDFHRVLSAAFTVDPVAFDASWREAYDTFNPDCPGFDGWRALIIRQIVDLREMAETEVLTNEYRYFGISAPRGSYWFNFDPVPYIECATAGSLGGWEPDDATGRQFVPGQVALMDANGAVRTADPETIARPVFQIASLSWDEFKDFLECGQTYE